MMYIPQLTSTVIQHSTPSATLANLSCRFETGTISPSIIGIIVCRVRESNSNSPRYGIVHVKSVEQFGIRPSALTFEHSNLPVERLEAASLHGYEVRLRSSLFARGSRDRSMTG
ncbi:unnamed protein product [Somion occarium]|uniref:Uncharacterized protein n=1 Tax=Somion occarium TaxID=3059160 RepID=A0ABP1EA78_9APHY